MISCEAQIELHNTPRLNSSRETLCRPRATPRPPTSTFSYSHFPHLLSHQLPACFPSPGQRPSTPWHPSHRRRPVPRRPFLPPALSRPAATLHPHNWSRPPSPRTSASTQSPAAPKPRTSASTQSSTAQTSRSGNRTTELWPTINCFRLNRDIRTRLLFFILFRGFYEKIWISW
jgi:hypothetical protein